MEQEKQHTLCEMIRKEYLSCPSCHHILTDPRTLPTCGHTACMKCLVPPHEHPANISCPKCGIASGVSIYDLSGLGVDSDIKELFAVLDAITNKVPACSTCHARASLMCFACKEFMCSDSCVRLHSKFYPKHKVSMVAETGSSMCHNCNYEGDGIRYCIQCDEVLCTDCVQIHNMLVTNQRHDLESLSPAPTDWSSMLYFTPCTNDCKSGLSMFCKECGTMFCQSCSKSHHEGHDVVVLDNVKEDLLEDLENYLCSLGHLYKEALARNSILERYNESVLEEFYSFSHTIKRRTEVLCSYLKEIENTKLANASVIFNLEQIDNDKLNLQNYIESISQTSQMCSQMLMHSSSKEAIPLLALIKSKLCVQYHFPEPRTKLDRMPHMIFESGKQDLKVSLQTVFGSVNTDTKPWNSSTQEPHASTLAQLADKIEVLQCELAKSQEDVKSSWISALVSADTGEVFAVDRTNKKIKIFGSDLKLKGEFDGDLKEPFDITVYGKGTVAVSDTEDCCVKILNLTGELEQIFMTQRTPFGISSVGAYKLVVSDTSGNTNDLENGLSCDSFLNFFENDSLENDGNSIYFVAAFCDKIAICSNKHHVVKLYSDIGQLLRTYGSFGNGEGNLSYPRGVCIDKHGNVIVADVMNHRIQLFLPEGGVRVLTTAKDGITNPHALDIDKDGHLLVSHGKQYGHVQYISRVKYLKW